MTTLQQNELVRRWEEQVLESLALRKIASSSGQREMLTQFLVCLWEESLRMNLTAVPPDRFVERHIVDSLLPLFRGAISSPSTLLDLGSGAGLPGIPLAIMLPETAVTLLDSTEKRVHFLQDVIAQLSLSNASALAGRAEELGRTETHRERYDVVTARAVSPLQQLLELAVPLATESDGRVIAFKGAESESEIRTSTEMAEALGVTMEAIAGEEETVLVVARKVRETPERFPRSYAAIIRSRQR